MRRVDVVIPCYNYGNYLRACVESVLSQRDVEVRALIIDDCSSDTTVVVGSVLAREDSRVRFRRHTTNRGHIATYNEGLLEWADADYCLLLSADDMLAPGALARAVDIMEANPSVGLVYGDAPKTSTPEALYGEVAGDATYAARFYRDGEFFEWMCREAWNMVPTPTAVVRMSLQRQIGGYNAALPHSGDMEMWLRCAAHADVVALDGVQAFYRTHTSQMSTSYVGVTDFREVDAAFDAVFANHGDRLKNTSRLRQLARQGLADRAFWTAMKRFEGTQGYQPYLDFALALDPTLRERSSWRRFQLKRLIGPTLWTRVMPFVRGRRRQPAA
jgi:glycosyltransferase involved in cell wall biosynthesis